MPGADNMPRYRYKIYKNNQLVLTNWIDASNKDEALEELEPVKKEYDATHIKVMETTPASQWSC